MAFAGTNFVIASARNVNRLSFFAPFADAAVTIDHSGTTTNVTVPVGTSVSVESELVSAPATRVCNIQREPGASGTAPGSIPAGTATGSV